MRLVSSVFAKQALAHWSALSIPGRIPTAKAMIFLQKICPLLRLSFSDTADLSSEDMEGFLGSVRNATHSPRPTFYCRVSAYRLFRSYVLAPS